MDIPKPPQQFNGELPTAIPLTEFSTDSLEVLHHFGIDAPSKLNDYSMALEDTLVEAVEKLKAAREEITELKKLLSKHNIPYDKSHDSNSASTTS